MYWPGPTNKDSSSQWQSHTLSTEILQTQKMHSHRETHWEDSAPGKQPSAAGSAQSLGPFLSVILTKNMYLSVPSSEETRAQEDGGGMSTSGKMTSSRGADESWECHPQPRLTWPVKAPYRPQYQRNKRKRAGKRRRHYKPSLFF